MGARADEILQVLDSCCDSFTFPMLDNGYVYLAATRLALFHSPADWALVIEVFGFSPRAGLPDTHIHTFASRLHDRDTREDYRSAEAYERYLANSPNNESRFVHPVESGAWQEDDSEAVAKDARFVTVRGRPIALPELSAYAQHGIELEEPNRVQVFELCRYLASVARDSVLAASEEQRISVPPELERLLVLDEWNHPNVVDDAERPSGSPTFRMLAEVLETGNAHAYRAMLPANTHWRNWPGGGSL